MPDMKNINCPCKRIHCERHGNCQQCRLYHETHTRYRGSYCDRQKKKKMKRKKPMETPHVKPISAPLLAWYDNNARVLPWRENPQPYYVWISEIMLQQTRVEAVKSYFDRFICELPDIKALAEVPQEKLMKLWEGLGYYNRARNLQKAAQEMMGHYYGRMPGDYESLLSLPGIGPYTAGAIASIAFGQAVPAIDGNVLRVLARVLALEDDIAKDATKKSLSHWIQEIIPTDRPGDFNQSLMELGATICLPNGAPKCLLCPLQGLCEAYENGTVSSFPVKSVKKPRKLEEKTILLLTCKNKIAIHRREGKGVLSGLWEFPNLESTLNEEDVFSFLKKSGISPVNCSKLKPYKHIFTHIEWHISGFRIELPAEINGHGWRWVSVGELSASYALPSAFQPYLHVLLNESAGDKK